MPILYFRFNNLIKVWIILLKLLESVLLVDVKHLIFDTMSLPLLFFFLFLPIAILTPPFFPPTKKYFPLSVGTTVLQINPLPFSPTTNFLDPQAGSKATMLATFFPKCVILASCSPDVRHFGDFFAPKCIRLATFSPNMHHSGNFFLPPEPPTSLLRPPPLPFSLFSIICNIFHSFFEKMLPALGGDHIFPN